MNDSIYKSIKTLPPLDDTVIKIQQICRDENATIGELVDVIKKDPMLTANILHSANSPLYGFSREITEINQAVNLFGMATIRGFALYGAIKQNFKINLDPYSLNSEQFLDIVSTQNALAFDWCKKLGGEFLNVISPASFLMEVGKIIIAKELIESGKADEFKKAFDEIKSLKELSELEISLVGVDSEEVAAKILEQWNFEYKVVESILHINDFANAPTEIRDYSAVLNVVKNVVNVFSKFSEEGIVAAKANLKTAGLNESTFNQALEKVGV